MKNDVYLIFRVTFLISLSVLSGCITMPDEVSVEFLPVSNHSLNHYITPKASKSGYEDKQ